MLYFFIPYRWPLAGALLAGLLAGSHPACAQLDTNNNGAQVVFAAGAIVGVVGDYRNNSGSTDALAGSTVYLYRNFWSAASPTATLGSGTGQWRLQGSAAQTVDANGGALPTLLLNNPAGAGLLSNLGTTNLTLDNGYFYLNASDLRVGSDGSIAGVVAASRFVVTNGAGFLRRPTAGAFYPIGSAPGSYNPATLTAGGTPDFGARVADNVYLAGGGKSGPTQPTDVVNRHWELTGYGAAPVPLTIELQWDPAHEAPAFDRTQSAVGFFTGLAPTQYNQPPFAQFDSATPVGSAFQQEATYPTAGGVFIVGDRQSPLPVTLVEFAGQRLSASQVELSWRTAQEKDNSGFEVQRADAETPTNFRRVGWVAARGTSAGSYRFLDPNSSPAITYYRLRQVDTDGTATLSPVRTVGGSNGAAPTLTLYPNPATGTATLDLSQLPVGAYRATLLDLAGRTVRTNTYGGGQAHTLDLFGLATGAYLVQVQGAAGWRQQVRLLVK